MNALINTNRLSLNHTEKKEELSDKKTVGDVLAVSIIGFYTVLAIVVSAWSAVQLFLGNTADDGPIGFIINMMFKFS